MKATPSSIILASVKEALSGTTSCRCGKSPLEHCSSSWEVCSTVAIFDKCMGIHTQYVQGIHNLNVAGQMPLQKKHKVKKQGKKKEGMMQRKRMDKIKNIKQ